MSGRQKMLILLVLFGTMILSAGIILRFKIMPEMKRLSASSWARNLELAASAYQSDTGQAPPMDSRELVRLLGGGVVLPHTDSSVSTQPGTSAVPKNYLGQFPIMQQAGIAVDPWQQPMQIQARPDGGLRVVSPGPDRTPNTPDDIDSSFAAAAAAKIEAKEQRRRWR